MWAIAYFDGGSRGGIACWAYIIRLQNGVVFKASDCFKGTNNEAEWSAVLSCVERIAQIYKRYNINKVTVYGDSELVIKQIKGEYKMKAPNLKPLYDRTMSLIQDLTTSGVDITFAHIPRHRNLEADLMTRRARSEYIKRANRRSP